MKMDNNRYRHVTWFGNLLFGDTGWQDASAVSVTGHNRAFRCLSSGSGERITRRTHAMWSADFPGAGKINLV